MGLFKKSKETAVPGKEDLGQVRVKAMATFALAEVFDAEVLKPQDEQQGLRATLAQDFTYFMACLAEIDGKLEQNEIEVLNAVLGVNLDEAACAELLEGKDPVRLTRTVPASFDILKAHSSSCIAGDIAACAIDVYDMLGMAVAGADGTVEKEEAWEINGFVAMLRRYSRWD